MRNLLILAKWLAGRADIDVLEYQGSTACIALVEGRRVIKIPSHWSCTNDPEAAELLEGVIDHEALGHGRFTDLEARKRAEKAGVIQFTEFSKGVLNILEDVYIERRAIGTYPGVKANLKRTVEILAGRGFFGSPDVFAQRSGASLVSAGLLNVLRARLVPGQEDALRENVEALEVLLPAAYGGLWDEVLAIAMEVQGSTCTDDNIHLTVRIMRAIQDAAEDSGEDAGAEAAQKGTTPDLFDELTNDEAGDVGAEAGVSEGARRILSSLGEAMPTTEISEAASGAIGEGLVVSRPKRLAECGGNVKLSDAAMRVATKTKAVADDLQDALATETRNQRTLGLAGKRLRGRVLAGVRTGNPRIFETKMRSQGLSTAVLIVSDLSYSMKALLEDGVSRLDAAVGLTFGLLDVLDEFDVPCQAIAYSDTYATLKEFGQEWAQVRKRREHPQAGGDTFSGAALQRSLGDLVQRPEDRKLVILITDGEPSDHAVLVSCYSEAQEMGVEIASVMVGPRVLSIESLANELGFKATNINTSSGLGRFAVERVLEAI